MELYNAFVQSVRQHPDSVAISWDEESMTYEELLKNSNILAHVLEKELQPGRQNIGLYAPNTPYFIIGLFGILGAGQIAVPLNPLLNPEEVSFLISHAEITRLLVDPMLLDKAKKALEIAGLEIEIMVIPDWLQGQTNSETLSPGIDEDDLAMILYTSGTTGNPKGVMLSHRNIHWNYEAFKSVLDFQDTDTFLSCLPLHHTYAMTVNVFGSLLIGARLVLYLQFDPRKIVQAFVSEPNIVFAAVAPMLLMTARFAPENAAQQHRMRFIIAGGGPLPDEVYHLFKQKYNYEILQGYGLTETSPVVAYNPPGSNKIGTIGPPLPGVNVQIRNDRGEVLGSHEIGELCVQGPLVMKGYFKNEDATRAAFFENGWLRTGDMAFMDEDGYIKIVGRSKDIIVCGGENIYPQEIEDTLAKHPAVIESAIVGKPDKLRSEVPHAFVILAEQDKENITESDLRKFCREHLGEFKIPEGFTFVDELPRTAKGTIEKKVLRKQLAT